MSSLQSRLRFRLAYSERARLHNFSDKGAVSEHFKSIIGLSII